jgi:hypothetical protein
MLTPGILSPVFRSKNSSFNIPNNSEQTPNNELDSSAI